MKLKSFARCFLVTRFKIDLSFLKELTCNITIEFALIKKKKHCKMPKQFSIFLPLQPKLKRRCIDVEENYDENLKNDVHSCSTRLVDNVAKMLKEKDKIAKNEKWNRLLHASRTNRSLVQR